MSHHTAAASAAADINFKLPESNIWSLAAAGAADLPEAAVFEDFPGCGKHRRY